MSGSPRSPSDYARQKQDEALVWWRGELGGLQRDLGRVVTPLIAPSAWAGFGTNGDPRSPGGTAAFWELGWGGTSGGTTAIVPPHCDRTVINAYCDNHDDSRVFMQLGRAASMEIGGWRELPDQTAVAIVDIVNHGLDVSSALSLSRPSGALTRDARPATFGGLWFGVLAFGGWSGGAGRFGRGLVPYDVRLAGVPEDGRFGALLYAVAVEVWNGASFGPAESHESLVWTLLRTWQKIEAARWIEIESGGSDVGFYDFHGTADWEWVAEVITRAAYGLGLAGLRQPRGGYAYDAPSRWRRVAQVAAGAGAGALVLGALAWHERKALIELTRGR